MVLRLTGEGWEDFYNGSKAGSWSKESDYIPGRQVIRVDSGAEIKTGGGADYIISGTEFSKGETSFFNQGSINTSDGNDFVLGNTKATFNAIGLQQSGSLVTGVGDDIVIGRADSGTLGNDKTGLQNSGEGINTGAGNDVVYGYAYGNFATGLDNFSEIKTGIGDDQVLGVTQFSSSGAGINNRERGTISTGEGNDTVKGWGRTTGVFNKGIIDLGKGNDLVSASFDQLATGKEAAIRNSGTINLGKGNDTVDALTGSFGKGFDGILNAATGKEVGTINLGEGNDTLLGYGAQNIDGGEGYDTVFLGVNVVERLFNSEEGSDSMDADLNIETLPAFSYGDMNFTNVERLVFNDFAFSIETGLAM